jgi:cytoplasmic iron level regulating protein YaaA (DUF328/UPF0246 family)
MKIVISPAKSLNFEKITNQSVRNLCFKTITTNSAGFKTGISDNLSALMHISDKLANLNWERNQAWKTPFTSDNARPAIYTFDGDVYGCLYYT